jgi:hypothetical protein
MCEIDVLWRFQGLWEEREAGFSFIVSLPRFPSDRHFRRIFFHGILELPVCPLLGIDRNFLPGASQETNTVTFHPADRFPEHEAELTVSLGTGIRLSEQYTLAWKNVDLIDVRSTSSGSDESKERRCPERDA